jgi:iron complex outermembrane receptor protein
VTNDFDLTLGGTYLHARYSSFPGAVLDVPTGFGGNVTVPADVSGNTMIRSPTLSANLTGRYVAMTQQGSFEAAATLFYSTKVYLEFGNRIVQPAYALLNASLAWEPPGTGLRVTLWGKNLTDKAALYSTIVSQLYDAADYTPPRTAGIELKYAF